MELDSVGISNFKSLREAHFEPGKFGCLVGENNAGKSSVMQAIVYALKRPVLPASLFYDQTLPVVFVLRFSGVTPQHLSRLDHDEHRERISRHVHDGVFTIRILCKPGEKASVSVDKRVPRERRFSEDGITAAIGGQRGEGLRTEFLNTYPELAEQIPEQFNMAAAKELLQRHIRELPAHACNLEDAPLPVGIHPAISSLLPDVIYIRAVKNLKDDMKTTQSTSFGRLMSLMLDDMAEDLDQIAQALTQLNVLFNRSADSQAVDARHPKVRSLEELVERLLRESFPAARVELEVPPPDLKTILGTALIYIDDGSKDLIENKGDGIKRALAFCLLQAYVERTLVAPALGGEAGTARRPLLFLFEEPELYLHPKSQRVLFNTLARISGQHQVVVSTHSPLFFAPGVTASFVRVAKEIATPKPVGKLYPVAVDLESNNLGIFQLAKFENVGAAFFSRRVVLFEGESDDLYCAKVAKLLHEDWDFDSSNIALVRVSGKGNFAKYRAFFEAFGIDVKIVADLDALFDGFQHLNGSDRAQQLRDVAMRAIDERIVDLNIRAEPTADQIRSRRRSQSLRQKWDDARMAVRDMQSGTATTVEHLGALDALFTWEADISRLKVCKEDLLAAQAIVPLLDELRSQGVCVLSRGAIEDYYPVNALRTGSKPECALRAAGMLTHREHCRELSRPLGADRPSELEEIFAELFREA